MIVNLFMAIMINTYKDKNKYIHSNKVNTNFQGKKSVKENASYKCLSLVMSDSVIKTSKTYYPQTLLEESKCEAKKTKMDNLVNDEVESSFSDDESDNETKSDNESSN